MDMTHSRAVKDQAFVTRLLADLVRATPDDLDALLEQGIERVGPGFGKGQGGMVWGEGSRRTRTAHSEPNENEFSLSS